MAQLTYIKVNKIQQDADFSILELNLEDGFQFFGVSPDCLIKQQFSVRAGRNLFDTNRADIFESRGEVRPL